MSNLKLALTLSVAVSAAFTGGCTLAPADPSSATAYHREDFRIRFVEDRERCHAAGGRMFVQVHGGSLDRDGVPRTRAPYYCQ